MFTRLKMLVDLKLAAALLLFQGCLTTLCIAQQPQPDLRQSVVQITVTTRFPNFYQPWLKQPGNSSGSGSLIGGNRVLTNAHVVSYASQIYVQGYQSAERVAAKVLYMDSNIDLAVLQIEDATFSEKRPAIQISDELPKSGAAVSVYGFPVGGNELSTTEGVVSRIEFAPFFNGSGALRIQVDAAINPGNSGGPAIAGGKLIGVAFSKAAQAENIGYLIAAEEVKAFLTDIEDGRVDGRAQWLHQFQPLENDAIRSFFKLEKGIKGVLITGLHGPKDQQLPLNIGDILTHVGGHPIDNDGKVNVGESLRVPFFYHVPRLARNGKVELTIRRDSQSQEISLPVSSKPSLLVNVSPNEYPRYFIYGPLAFSAVTAAMAEKLPPQLHSMLLSRNSPFMIRKSEPPAFPGEELVVVPSNAFSSPLTKGYGSPALATLESINGEKVKNLAHAATLIRQAKDEFILCKFADHGVGSIVFRRSEVEAATESILQDNGIRSDCSDDLRAIWSK